jgi:Fe-S-cluster-containing hydrogenase component 2
LVFDFPGCGGCTTCELACSFHHTGFFSSANSSIKIISNKGKEGYAIEFHQQAKENIPICDGCSGLDTPLCMQFCKESEKLGEIIEEFTNKRPR